MEKAMKNKLTSRKFWVAVATIVSGVLMMFNFSDSSIETISGAIVALGGAIGYMIVEGMVDANRVKSAIDNTEKIVETVEDELEKK